MTVALVIATKTVRLAMPNLQSYGSVIGATVSGVFLWLIGILNLLVLLDILHIWRQMKRGTYHQERLKELLVQRGLIRRVLGGRLQNLINHSWQMFGTVELLQVLARELNLHGQFFNALAALDFESLGYSIVALFIVGWGLSVLIWKFRRIEERWGTSG
jgi:high-affinity nickel permease